MNLRKNVSFGFEQTFTIANWWEEEGFCNKSDTKLKRTKMLDLANNLKNQLECEIVESKDEWEHIQYKIVKENEVLFYITMDPGCIEVKTAPKLIDGIEEFCSPLFEAATKSELYPYRNWWYGVQKGTEGGCHVNMGALSIGSNPFVQNPSLLAKYAAFTHNRPFLSYPFMGVDVGTGGNAQRMDEKEDFEKNKLLFNKLDLKSLKSLDDLYAYFEESSLVTDKSSFPSFRKLPLKMIEDRAQESFRSSHEMFLICKLKLKILEFLQTQSDVEKLESFDNLYKKGLTSFQLWSDFINFSNKLEINPVDYQIFFDRQFPKLFMGENAPKQFTLKEGRRPRKVLEVYRNEEGEVTGKKVDASYLRFEAYYNTISEEQFEFQYEYEGAEDTSETFRHSSYLGFGEAGTSYYSYIDLKVLENNSILKIKLIDKLIEEVVDECQFDLEKMMFI